MITDAIAQVTKAFHTFCAEYLRNNHLHIRFEVFMVVMKVYIVIFWDVTPYSCT
jgi:hypothetical protein